MYIYSTDKHIHALTWFFHDHMGHKLRSVNEHAFDPDGYGGLAGFAEFKVPKGPVPRP